MPGELEHPTSAVSTNAAISVLLCMLSTYAAQAGEQPSSRLGQRIYRNLEALSQRDDLPEVLKQICDELRDVWQGKHACLQGGYAC